TYLHICSNVHLSFTPYRTYRRDSLQKLGAVSKIDSLDNVYTLEVSDKTQQISLHFLKKYPGSGDILAHEIGMKFSFDQFISFLLTKNVFDEYIIFSNGKTVYETFPAGISYV